MAITYKSMSGPTTLLMYSDSAFKKEDETGHAIKGSLYLRVPTDQLPKRTAKGLCKLESPGKDLDVHVIDYICRSQKHVTRSTFSSELFGGCDTIDHGFLLVTLLHQIHCGSTTAAVSKELREIGGYYVPMILVLDAYSVFSAATAGQIKVPADSSLLAHVQYIRELLDNYVLKELWWADTRDMIADGLTKGSVDRAALDKAMEGAIQILHTVHSWKSFRNGI